MPDRRGTDTSARILIGGPGRSGTTLLVQYFTALGFDTGFTQEQAMLQVNPIANAGLEHSLKRTLEQGRQLPYVAKSPWFGPRLGRYLESGELQISYFVIAIRALEDAAASRRRVSQAAVERGLDPHRQPGGVIAGNTRGSQEKKLAMQLYRLVETLAAHGVPTLLLHFPRFASDPVHLHTQLRPLHEAHGVSIEESTRALAEVADLGRISTFDES